MPVNTLHLRSSVKGQEPTAGTAQGQLPVGSIAINFNADEPFLAIQDSSGSIRRIAGVKIDSTAPQTPTAGEWWVDTSGATKIAKVFDGTAWVATGLPVADATTSVKGIAQLADAAAITAGTAGRVVTANQLKTTNDAVAANTASITTVQGNITTIQGQITTIQGQVVDATTAVKGVVRLADAAAVTAGTPGRAVTADQLKASNDSITTIQGQITTIQGQVTDASTTAKGVVQLATSAEVLAGTDTVKAVTPKGAADTYLPRNISLLPALP